MIVLIYIFDLQDCWYAIGYTDDILAMIIERFPKDLAEGLAPVEPGSDADLGPLTTMPISLVACLKVCRTVAKYLKWKFCLKERRTISGLGF